MHTPLVETRDLGMVIRRASKLRECSTRQVFGAGVVLPLLNQTILLWQVLLGSVVLGQRYSPVQLFGILLVVAGVAKAAWPSGAGGSILGQVIVFDS